MQSFLYLNADRIKSVFAQRTSALQTQIIREVSLAAAGEVSGSIFPIFSSRVKGTKGLKTIAEEVTTPEQMVAALLSMVAEETLVQPLVEDSDWNAVSQGGFVVFSGNLEFDSYGLSKEQLRNAAYEEAGERKVYQDFRLKGPVAGRQVEIPFSSNWVTGPTSFTILCHAKFKFLEGLAFVMSNPDLVPVTLQPLAFGNGFIK